MMNCPACKTASPDSVADSTTPPCVCGYAFYGPQTDSIAVLSATMRYVRTIKNIAITWSVLIAVGWVLTMVIYIATEVNRR